jgi:hypothetical protein
MLSLNELITLAKEVEAEDPIDWGMLNISEDDAYKLIALDVMEMFNAWSCHDEKEIVMLVTITKLILENFVLNLKLQQRTN